MTINMAAIQSMTAPKCRSRIRALQRERKRIQYLLLNRKYDPENRRWNENYIKEINEEISELNKRIESLAAAALEESKKKHREASAAGWETTNEMFQPPKRSDGR